MGSDPMPAAVVSSPGEPADRGATAAVTALYQANALSMVRLAHVILGDRSAAEDVVQDAFSGLYRRWGRLSDPDKALSYVRTSVLNACRTALRRGRCEFSAESPDDAARDAARPGQSAGREAVSDEDERASEQVPPYYAALRYEHPFTSRLRADVTIRSTATGKVLAAVPPLAGGFAAHMVSAAADDRTFVMAASRLVPATSRSVPVRFYLLRFDPATDTVAVRDLPISDVTANGSDGLFEIDLSPDGQRLAVITDTFRGIRVYSVPGGAQRAWTTSVASQLLSPVWVGGSRVVAFFDRPLDLSAHEVGLRLLDTASPSHDLLAASHKPPVLLRYECGPAWFAPRPSMIACVIEKLHRGGIRTAYVAEVSLRTGKLLRRLPLPPPGPVPYGAVPQVAWANAAGTKAIVIMNQSRPKPSGSASAYLVTSGQVTRIPGATWAGTVNIYLPASW